MPGTPESQCGWSGVNKREGGRGLGQRSKEGDHGIWFYPD